MTFHDFLRDDFLARVRRSECLVVYDPEGRYGDVVRSLEAKDCTVVDTSRSALEGRLDAQRAFSGLGEVPRGEGRLVVHVTFAKPLTHEACLLDPYRAFAISGAAFPEGASDEPLELAIRAKPGREDEVRALFAGGHIPDAATIDALDDGPAYPRLRRLLAAESTREIVLALLVMTTPTAKRLASDPGWIDEYRTLAREALGMEARAATSDGVQEELARYVLVSEFAFDQPSPWPAALAAVPRAPDAQRELVLRLCKEWRGSAPTSYLRLANHTSDVLELPGHYQGVTDFGHRDTFGFEEQASLAVFAGALGRGDLAAARALLVQRDDSIWAGLERRREAWSIAEIAYEVAEALDELPPLSSSLAAQFDAYVTEGHRLDALQRLLETRTRAHPEGIDVLEPALEGLRGRLGAALEARQAALVTAAEREHWPVPGALRQTEVFDRVVAPSLSAHGHRVAYVLTDALRYELGVDLARRLRASGADVDLEASCAVLPTITPVGMAALLPEASSALSIAAGGEVMLDSTPAPHAEARRAWTRQRYGDRVAFVDMADVLRSWKLKKTPQLLVVSVLDIDKAGESGGFGLLDTLESVLKRLTALVGRLRTLGYERVVFTADHGFLLREELAGDKVVPPEGTWGIDKDRARVGRGTAPATTLRLTPATSGTPGSYDDLVVPRTFGTFRTGTDYRHGGLSWQEAIVPVVTVRLRPETATSEMSVTLRYRAGATDRVTSRRPALELSVFRPEAGLLDSGGDIRLRVNATSEGTRMGHPTGAYYDEATDLVTLSLGSSVKLMLALEEAFEGPFVVTVSDPDTHIVYARLDLRTDYVG